MTQRLTRNVLVLSVLAALRAAPALGEEITPGSAAGASPAAEKVQQTMERGLTFLVEDAAKWRKDRGCATCHHGAMTVWALSEARSQGYVVPAETLADTIKWTKDLLVPQFSKPRDPRWGYNFVSLPAMYLALMSHNLPILSRDEINRVAVHLARHQEEDGVWLMPPPNPNGSPPTYESRETIALLALLAWEPHAPADPRESASVRAARDKTVAWLQNAAPTETTQALSLRLLLDIRTGRPAEDISKGIARLLGRQQADGGWGQLRDLPGDAYATGQVLWVLSFAGIRSDHPQIRRAVSFLVATQRENGAWPMSPRSHPEKDTSKDRNLVPLTYFGSAWAVLGLARFVPPTLDAATRQQRAFAYIRTFSGRLDTDQNLPGNPVLSVTLTYEVDDDQVTNLARLLTAFPHLKSLNFKSPSITDAGSEQLKVLTQLRILSLEQAALTDAGLAHLKALTGLEELNLKGTRVTDAGVEDFQKTLSKVKVQR